MYTPNKHRKTIEQAVYVVLVRVKQMNPDDPNTEIVTAKLRRSDADIVCREVPGAWVEKVIASKP